MGCTESSCCANEGVDGDGSPRTSSPPVSDGVAPIAQTGSNINKPLPCLNGSLELAHPRAVSVVSVPATVSPTAAPSSPLSLERRNKVNAPRYLSSNFGPYCDDHDSANNTGSSRKQCRRLTDGPSRDEEVVLPNPLERSSSQNPEESPDGGGLDDGALENDCSAGQDSFSLIQFKRCEVEEISEMNKTQSPQRAPQPDGDERPKPARALPSADSGEVEGGTSGRVALALSGSRWEGASSVTFSSQVLVLLNASSNQATNHNNMLYSSNLLFESSSMNELSPSQQGNRSGSAAVAVSPIRSFSTVPGANHAPTMFMPQSAALPTADAPNSRVEPRTPMSPWDVSTDCDDDRNEGSVALSASAVRVLPLVVANCSHASQVAKRRKLRPRF